MVVTIFGDSVKYRIALHVSGRTNRIVAAQVN